MMARDLVAELLKQHSRIFDPSIMIDRPPRGLHAIPMRALQIPVIGLAPEADRIAAGFHLPIVPNETDGAVIEPGVARPIVSVEMEIAKREPQDGGVAEFPFHGLADRGMVGLMQDLIGLEIERPVSRAMGQGDVGLDREEQSVLLHPVVPIGLDDPYFVGTDGANQLDRSIVRLPDIDDELIHQGQGRGNHLHNGIVELHRIATDGKSADFHGAQLLWRGAIGDRP